MTLAIHWFWLAKISTLFTFIFTFYRYYKTESKFWLLFAVISMVLIMINPIKIEQDKGTIQNMNYNIKSKKQKIPKMIKDTSFDDSKVIEGIQEKDLK